MFIFVIRCFHFMQRWILSDRVEINKYLFIICILYTGIQSYYKRSLVLQICLFLIMVSDNIYHLPIQHLTKRALSWARPTTTPATVSRGTPIQGSAIHNSCHCISQQSHPWYPGHCNPQLPLYQQSHPSPPGHCNPQLLPLCQPLHPIS